MKTLHKHRLRKAITFPMKETDSMEGVTLMKPVTEGMGKTTSIIRRRLDPHSRRKRAVFTLEGVAIGLLVGAGIVANIMFRKRESDES
jgi:hypothetical protein